MVMLTEAEANIVAETPRAKSETSSTASCAALDIGGWAEHSLFDVDDEMIEADWTEVETKMANWHPPIAHAVALIVATRWEWACLETD